MSIEAMMWAKRQRLKPLGGTVAHRAILMVLADYADESGECFPGQELIGWETEQSERTVRRHVGDLENWGLLARHARFRTDDRSGRNVRTSDRYVLSLSVEFSGGQLGRCQTDRRSTEGVLTGQHAEVVPDNSVRVSVSRTDSTEPTEKSGRTKRTRVPEPFEITDELKAWATKNHPGVEPRWFVSETEHFVGYHAARGTVFQDWGRAWQNWMNRGVESVKRRPGNLLVDTGVDRAEQAAMFERGTG